MYAMKSALMKNNGLHDLHYRGNKLGAWYWAAKTEVEIRSCLCRIFSRYLYPSKRQITHNVVIEELFR